MPPSYDDSVKHKPSLNFKYPTNRDINLKTGDSWLDGKRADDGAEGHWRVHNNLYDVTDFIDKHPGGKMWLELTKGTDITEAFESHHLTSKPEELLKKYFIRAARTPRNSPFTFEEEGFYKTLKRNIAPVLKTIPKDCAKKSDRITDSLVTGTFVFAVLACNFESYLLGFLAGVCLGCTTVAAHNYCHKKDNFRMYYINLSLLQFREWRITHALSHHLFPNTIADIEISAGEPIIEYLPCKKSFIIKFGSIIYVTLLWITWSYFSTITKFIQLYNNDTRNLHWSDIIPLTLPTAMYIFSDQPLYYCVGMWLYIIAVGSTWMGAIGSNAGHHAPEIFHEGDTPRSSDYIDWGIHQLDIVADRYDINKSFFLVLTGFGHHGFHHFFPTLDHAVLEYLYPVIKNTMAEFNVDLRLRSQLQMIQGQYLQLLNESPNPNPPALVN